MFQPQVLPSKEVGVGWRDDFVKRLGTRSRELIEVNKAAKNCNEEGRLLMKREQESRVSAEEDKAVTYVSNQALPTRKKLHSSSTRSRATLTWFKSYFADLMIGIFYNNKWKVR